MQGGRRAPRAQASRHHRAGRPHRRGDRGAGLTVAAAPRLRHLSLMFIRTEETPNPLTLKFIPGRPVMTEGVREFATPEEAAESPLAEALFDVDGVSRVYFGPDFVTVT